MSDLTASDLAHELATQARARFAALQGRPWEEGVRAIEDGLRALVAERFPELPAAELDEILGRYVRRVDGRLSIDFDAIAERLLAGADTSPAPATTTILPPESA